MPLYIIGFINVSSNATTAVTLTVSSLLLMFASLTASQVSSWLWHVKPGSNVCHMGEIIFAYPNLIINISRSISFTCHCPGIHLSHSWYFSGCFPPFCANALPIYANVFWAAIDIPDCIATNGYSKVCCQSLTKNRDGGNRPPFFPASNDPLRLCKIHSASTPSSLLRLL